MIPDINFKIENNEELMDKYEHLYVLNYWRERVNREGLKWDEVKDLVDRLYTEHMHGACDWFDGDIADDNLIHAYLKCTAILNIDDFLDGYGDYITPTLNSFEDIVNEYANDWGKFYDKFGGYFDYNDKYVILGDTTL